jgi:hypothetical protein
MMISHWKTRNTFLYIVVRLKSYAILIHVQQEIEKKLKSQLLRNAFSNIYGSEKEQTQLCICSIYSRILTLYLYKNNIR